VFLVLTDGDGVPGRDSQSRDQHLHVVETRDGLPRGLRGRLDAPAMLHPVDSRTSRWRDLRCDSDFMHLSAAV
jgi:hypothetical protein